MTSTASASVWSEKYSVKAETHYALKALKKPAKDSFIQSSSLF